MSPWGSFLLAASLVALTAMLAGLCFRGLRRYAATRSLSQGMWGIGLLFATGAMAIESIIYLGARSTVALQAYVFFSAAIVGVLSLGATRVLRRPRLERGYRAYIVGTTALVAVASFLTPMPSQMIQAGIVVGNPPLPLILLSTLVTAPATVVLLASSVVALRRDHRWQTLLMIAGAVILGAGGTLYIAAFPIALYYAEFLGIVLLFFGLVSLPQAAPVPAPASGPRPAP